MPLKAILVALITLLLVGSVLRPKPVEAQAGMAGRVTALEALVADLRNQLADLRTAVNTEATTRDTADNVIQGNIDAEAEARQVADATLQAAIDVIAGGGGPPNVPPPAVDFSGTYVVSPRIIYTCGLGLIDLNITSFAFVANGTALIITGAPVAMTGIVSGSSFSVQGGSPGAVAATYSLNGLFDPNNVTWSGTLQATFSQGAGSDCQTQTFASLTGSR